METIIIGSLAVWEAIEIWRHSHLFATWRARVDLWEGRIGLLLRCPFCMAPWISLLVVLNMWAGEHLAQNGSRGLALVSMAIVYALAMARVANLFNDVFHPYCRTPKADQLDLDDDDEEDSENEDTPQPE
jgi:hypothetical protein